MLTGQVFKDSDHAIQKLLEEWRQFYPVDSKLGTFGSRDGASDSSQLPAFVEVIVGMCLIYGFTLFSEVFGYSFGNRAYFFLFF